MLKLTGVSKTYENKTCAINDISLTLPDVGFVAITGTSGCGKSTLLNLLSGNDFATSGTIEQDGKSYAEIGDNCLKKQFAYIYQDFKLIDNLTAYQNIMIGHELAVDKLDKDFVLDIAKQLEIEDVLDQKVYSLSGGQQQRVAIARSIVRSPKVIFADEPTGNLDTTNSINVLNILRKLATDKLVVVVSHDKSISQWADRTITLLDGKIVAEVTNENAGIVERAEVSKNQEEDDIEEILLLQKDVKHKKVSKIFSSESSAKRMGNKATLSAKSSLGLSVSLLNKDIPKKVCLTIVAVILIAFMTLSCAMTFATVEKTMANAINANNGKKVFAINPTIDKPDYTILYEDMQNFDRIIADSGLDSMPIATGEVVSNGWDTLSTTNEVAKQVPYYSGMNLADMQNAIFTDEPDKLGIEILLGNAPIASDEIAISKSYYDFMLHYKTFEAQKNKVDYKFEFTKNNIINNTEIYNVFGVKICGVFDDKNSLDSSLKVKEISEYSAKEAEEINKMVGEQLNTNPLINLVIKCEQAQQDWMQFAGINFKNKMTIEGCYGMQNTEYYFDFAPLTDVTARYFNVKNSITLKINEIAISENMLTKINQYVSNNYSNPPKIEVGSTIPMSIVRMMTLGMMSYPDLAYTTKDVTIAYVVDSLGEAENTIFMSKETFDTIGSASRYSEKRLVYGDTISASSLKKLNNGFTSYVSSIFDSAPNSCITYSILGCPITRANEYGFVYICQEYLCIPLMLITVAMAIGIIVVFYSDFVKTKAKELLILKSLGAKTVDFVKIYGIFCLALICILLIFGCTIGSLLISLVNILVGSIGGYATVFPVFYLDAASVAFAIALVFIINVASNAISIAGLSGKNLRKAFQKIKK